MSFGEDVVELLSKEGLDLQNGVDPYTRKDLEGKIDELVETRVEDDKSTAETQAREDALEALSKEVKQRIFSWLKRDYPLTVEADTKLSERLSEVVDSAVEYVR